MSSNPSRVELWVHKWAYLCPTLYLNQNWPLTIVAWPLSDMKHKVEPQYIIPNEE